MIVFFVLSMFFSAIDEDIADQIHKKYSRNIIQAVEKYPYINSKGEKLQISQALIKAIIYQESLGIPNAKSHAGAKGLTQIMPQTAKILKCDYDRLDQPGLAIDCSVRFLAALLTYNKGDLIKSLSGYNGGTYSTETRATETNGLLAGRIYNNNETKNYVVSVLKWFEWFKKNVKSDLPIK
ncbi:MAG TPA: lytic transglycosylase domain-containing protein [bacterium]|nr:lytic transglycosylase domain-containing protein [bacterium]HPS30270.1 lytic transglycosylase domain-containing protein [bacterium]